MRRCGVAHATPMGCFYLDTARRRRNHWTRTASAMPVAIAAGGAPAFSRSPAARMQAPIKYCQVMFTSFRRSNEPHRRYRRRDDEQSILRVLGGNRHPTFVSISILTPSFFVFYRVDESRTTNQSSHGRQTAAAFRWGPTGSVLSAQTCQCRVDEALNLALSCVNPSIMGRGAPMWKPWA